MPDWQPQAASPRTLRSLYHWVWNQFKGLWTASTRLFSVAAYGGIRQSTPVALPDIGAGWTTLTADTDSVAVPRAVTQNTANNSLAVNYNGVWLANIGFSISHNEAQAGRTILGRLYNLTQATGGAETVVGIARNTDATIFSTTSLIELAEDLIGDEYVVQIGGGDTLLTVTENSFSFSLTMVGEFRG
jgi:hypothetical protein